ncbi:MAG: type II toxin-antitoxin system VapC family toxin [Acidobacteria bacterium]|nr:type II toxin-antitoxin system VapC family toxin [Acidobacteriota bacterium]
MSKPFVFDASVYIRALRLGEEDLLTQMRSDGSPIYLSSVVLEELFVGASDRKALNALIKLENQFQKVGRILTPSQSDWSATGRILNRVGVKYGFEKVGKLRLTNDTLLATSVARVGFKLFTINAKDFAMVSDFRKFDWEVIA